MNRFLWMAAACILCVLTSAQAAKQPNFIIIFCDDLGYADIGPFGSKLHRTPNLDKMAAEGIKFTNFYVTSGVCSPSRSSLMTGCYPARVGLHHNETGRWVLFPGNKRGLNPGEITIAEVLKQKGYATACIGKWHLGDQPAYLPTRQGFDYYFGIPYSNDMGAMNGAGEVVTNRNYPPLPLLRNEKIIETEPDQRLITKRYTKEVLSYIRKNKDNPFFLYFPQTMPHAPQFSSKSFAGKSKNGKWGDTVEEIDWSVGKVLEELKKQGIAENTFVTFLSDNGGALNWGANNAPLSGGKGSTMEGGQRVPFLGWWPGTIPAATTNHELATSMDLLPTIAKFSGAQAPVDRVIDGHDIRALLLNKPEAETPYEAFYYYYRRELQAVRSGHWKLHLQRTQQGRGKNAKPKTIPMKLINLNEDIAEKINVAQKHPEVVKQLQQLAEHARRDIGDLRQVGANTRAPGHIEDAVQLRR